MSKSRYVCRLSCKLHFDEIVWHFIQHFQMRLFSEGRQTTRKNNLRWVALNLRGRYRREPHFMPWVVVNPRMLAKERRVQRLETRCEMTIYDESESISCLLLFHSWYTKSSDKWICTPELFCHLVVNAKSLTCISFSVHPRWKAVGIICTKASFLFAHRGLPLIKRPIKWKWIPLPHRKQSHEVMTVSHEVIIISGLSLYLHSLPPYTLLAPNTRSLISLPMSFHHMPLSKPSRPDIRKVGNGQMMKSTTTFQQRTPRDNYTFSFIHLIFASWLL